MEKPFVINNRFRVDPSLHLLTDRDMEKDKHMEPRHVKLLCLLASNEGNLVEREFLVSEIWNNYGGADEALTQAISVLRKLLADHQKKLIETIPKKGYIMHATIMELPGTNHQLQPRRSGKRTGWLVGIMTLIILAQLVLMLQPVRKTKASPEKNNDPVITNAMPAESKNQQPADSKNSSPPVEGKDDARK